jgi:hypothetical protein
MRRHRTNSRKRRAAAAPKRELGRRARSGSRAKKDPKTKAVRLDDLSPRQLSDYEDSLAVLAAARRGYAFGFDTHGQFTRIPLRGVRHAARIIGIPFRKVERYVGSELFRNREGRIQVTSADRLPRPMAIPTALGDQTVVVRGSRKASLLAKYRLAILTGNESELQKFNGKRVGGQELITDIRTIQALLDAGAIDPAEMYAATQAGGVR